MSKLPPFQPTSDLTMGVELELQLISLESFNLAMEAEDFLRRLYELEYPGDIKPEITKSMIEINSSIHLYYETLTAELTLIKQILAKEAARTHIGISGGGTHPFQKWKMQRIFPVERFASISEQYGYLAKQFTVFGQHIHIACLNGDNALYLCHALARFIPHFIALAAASPFYQGVDSAFDCSRLSAINSFPLSGTPPWILTWDEFEEYFKKMSGLGIVHSMKDFYWDIRPKPEYGTIELRICDTPLTVDKATELAAFAQMIVAWLLNERPAISHDIYLTYIVNRFRATRYGLKAELIDPINNKTVSLGEDILSICYHVEPYAAKFNSLKALYAIRDAVSQQNNGAKWLRDTHQQVQSLPDTVRMAIALWASND